MKFGFMMVKEIKLNAMSNVSNIISTNSFKCKIIKKKEYDPYIIIDMGKYDKLFVEQEFAVFLLMRMATKILE